MKAPGESPHSGIEKYLPESVELYCVSYMDDLEGHPELLQKCVEANSLCPIDEKVYEMWDFPEHDYLVDIRRKMEADGAGHLYGEHYQDILDYLAENDESNPVNDLLDNTGKQTFLYSLGVRVGGWNTGFLRDPWRDEPFEESVRKVCDALSIEEGTPEWSQIEGIVDAASFGGDLRLYFKARTERLISPNLFDCGPEKGDFQSISFGGEVAVAVYDPVGGSGEFDYIKLNKTFKFVRKNLILSECEKYDIERSFGLVGYWLDRCAAPALSLDRSEQASDVAESGNAAVMERERSYREAFEGGGCTHGDMDTSRHRDLYYDNSVPCGLRCPHCGTFWID